MAEEPRLRLGRGLAALIGEASEDPVGADRNRGQRRVPIEFLRANPRNPRKTFDDPHLDELAESIREKGILQPIVVRELSIAPGVFEIIAGERRWRAAQRASLHTVPIVVIEATDKESLELAIIENVQRADLNALEEAEGYGQLIREFEYTQADLARIIGKSRSHVANTLRLVNLPDSIKQLLADGSLSAGHARALITLSNPESLAKRIVEQGLSVRDAEKISQDYANQDYNSETPVGETARQRRKGVKDPDTQALEKTIQNATGLSVDIKNRGESGEIRIRYKTLEQLDEICRQLTQSARA